MIIKKEFYFVRHGQTDYNKNASKEDHDDVSLNDTGRQQAASIESIIATLPIKTICVSPLKRAKETKEMISARFAADHFEILGLSECSAAIWHEMTSLGAQASSSDKLIVKNFMHQVLAGVNEALSQPGPVLIVAHGGVHWAMCCHMNVEHEWAIDNCIPVHFSYTEDGTWKAKKLV